MNSNYKVKCSFGVRGQSGYYTGSEVVKRVHGVANSLSKAFRVKGKAKYVNFQQEVNPNTTVVLDAPSYMPYDCLYLIQNIGYIKYGDYVSVNLDIILEGSRYFRLRAQETSVGSLAVFRLSGASNYPSLKNSSLEYSGKVDVVMIG